MSEQFKLFDTAGTGAISPGQLKEALEKIHVQCSDAYQKDLFDAADLDKDGKVSPEEFEKFMKRDVEIEPEDVVVKAFDALSDGSGQIEIEVLKDLMKNWGDHMSDEEVNFMLKDAMKFTSDGKIDYKGFAALMVKKP